MRIVVFPMNLALKFISGPRWKRSVQLPLSLPCLFPFLLLHTRSAWLMRKLESLTFLAWTFHLYITTQIPLWFSLRNFVQQAFTSSILRFRWIRRRRIHTWSTVNQCLWAWDSGRAWFLFFVFLSAVNECESIHGMRLNKNMRYTIHFSVFSLCREQVLGLIVLV